MDVDKDLEMELEMDLEMDKDMDTDADAEMDTNNPRLGFRILVKLYPISGLLPSSF